MNTIPKNLIDYYPEETTIEHIKKQVLYYQTINKQEQQILESEFISNINMLSELYRERMNNIPELSYDEEQEQIKIIETEEADALIDIEAQLATLQYVFILNV